ncbi:MAG: cell division protein FtsZ, partial [Thermodesulfobacteriota bacterium]
AHEDVNLIFGLVFDESMKGGVQITVIATGIRSAMEETVSNVIKQIPKETIDDDFEIPAFVRRRLVK